MPAGFGDSCGQNRFFQRLKTGIDADLRVPFTLADLSSGKVITIGIAR
jgi:hypothetical protein